MRAALAPTPFNRMVIRSLRLHNFRAHQDSTATFGPKMNLIYGPNGVGKTNILEAVHYLCLSKSFLTASDDYALRQGSSYFEVEGDFEGTRRASLRVRLVYVPGEAKRLFVNGAALDRLADVVGLVPVVSMTPEDYLLTAGGPDERRRFLNNIMSQARPAYMDDLVSYRRALKQRNELLYQLKRRPNSVAPDLLASWDEELVALGSRVVARRHAFIEQFQGYLEAAYQHLEAAVERPTMHYVPFTPLPPDADEEAIRALLAARMARVAARERAMGRTLLGPHRDELLFELNGMEVRRYASQGQHRTYGLALKLAQYFYLKDRLEEAPILLLDDLFDNLDEQRVAQILSLLASETMGQSLITAAQREPLASWIAQRGEVQRIMSMQAGPRQEL